MTTKIVDVLTIHPDTDAVKFDYTNTHNQPVRLSAEGFEMKDVVVAPDARMIISGRPVFKLIASEHSFFKT